MKKINFLILLFISIGISAQNTSNINSALKISDSLNYNTEIRIYQDHVTNNYSSLFRMFKDNKGKWYAEFYKYFSEVNGKVDIHTEKEILKNKNDFDHIFKNLLRSNILEIPSQDFIEWKLRKRGKVKKLNYKFKGKEIVEYQVADKVKYINDGIIYKFQVKAWNRKINNFEYSNPESYRNYYPEVDELIYVCEIINIIRSEFNIWNK